MNPIIDIDAEICQDAGMAMELEWLLTNGLGGFACSTITGCNTRKYHGLLNIALTPPTNRRLLLAKYDEALIYEGSSFPLDTNLHTLDTEMTGQRFLMNFRLDPFPIFTYSIGDVEIEKRLFMIQGENTIVVRYRIISGDEPVEIHVTPFVTYRDIHKVNPNGLSLDMTVDETENGRFRFRPTANAPSLNFFHNAKSIEKPEYTWARFHYPLEEELGYEPDDFLLRLCKFSFIIKKDEPAWIIATTNEETPPPALSLDREQLRRAQIFEMKAREIHPKNETDINIVRLLRAADSFIVKRGNGISVIAGYPWFTDWGRDAMISFRGLFLESGRFEEARTLLLSFLSHYKDGLIPNTFPDGEAAPLYNTIDASLWFIHAVYEYYQATKDLDAIRTPFMEVIKDIIQHYIKGAPFGIGQDSDSLISGGEEGWQLTWMDAKVDGKVITPRIGKNVEINALWYHALRVAAIFSDLLDDEDAFAAYGLHAEKVKQSFEENFWFEDGGYLYDTLGSNGADPSIRPNQVFALSLPHPVINGSKAESVLATLERFLLTPYGLRSLAPGHPDYKKRYQGNLFSRDMAYHQGTVWPWLIGAYIDALLHVKGANRTSAEEGMEIIQPLLQHLETACLGSVSEIFDAEPPHAPRGCFAQAWSVAELLRAYMKLTRILQAT